ncbi:PREDICTED: G-protein-signaling modulator 2 isoform X2 [Nicrophorus vespilloides]|uniref:G-protein-signaling modulator 2 isoform X2 n=1 Tax=Nicrophorus vespilloides TaxID=110193 RepID=A0ABM1MNH9_NICVS|nr:PREDICTED: G-protein-signaling modulator 2 isoform X2 [Nicrophorus vespilloides]
MSLSASAENLTRDTQPYDGSSNMCLELALEGERLCKAGDCRAGVAFFQAAIQAGTDDLRTLSAIYSQLGNAYFYLGDYTRAMQYHNHDLTLARTMGDKLGEAKSSGNLGNTLKVMGRFDEAVLYCKRHLELSKELDDRLSEGRALYNLGNVYHAKGKHIGRVGQKDPGEFSADVKTCLQQAVSHYEENLTLMRELGDIAAQGRACGNLGNTHYLLGDFKQAIKYHEERLSIARQFGDRAAERRAHSNLGNSHIFMGQFDEAAHHYKKTLSLAQELGDRAVEAQACYSLGNTYTLLRDYNTAIEYHLRHLLIAQHLDDRVGEGRACWSLGNAHAALSNHEKALEFATRHLEISKELGDPMGEATAKMNICDLKKVLNLPNSPDSDSSSSSTASCKTPKSDRDMGPVMSRLNRMTPDGKQRGGLSVLNAPVTTTESPQRLNEDEDSFFDLLSRFQSKRMDDQRCSLNVDNKENTNLVNLPKDGPADLLDMIVGMQSKRMDEQRAVLPHLPGLQVGSLQRLSENARNNSVPDDNFLEQLARCQSSRLEDQRSPLPAPAVDAESDPPPVVHSSGATVPDEDFFSLIMRFQSGRMDDQRAAVPHTNQRVANGTIPHDSSAHHNNNNNNNGNAGGKKKK